MTARNKTLYLAFLPCVLLTLTTASLAIRAPTKPLKDRLTAAETVFLGKVVNRTVTGDWARAELVVEEPLRNAKKGQKVEVIWRIKVGNFRIYDVAELTRGIAILKDKHQGRYWLRSDKFEKPDKLAEVKGLMGAALAKQPKNVSPIAKAKELKVTVTPTKPYVLPDGKTKIVVSKKSVYLGRGGHSGTVQVLVGDSVLDIAPRMVIAAGGYRFEFDRAPEFKFGRVRKSDMIFTVVESCSLTVRSSKQPGVKLAFKKLDSTLELVCYHSMPCLKTHTIRGEGKHFVGFKPTSVTVSRFHPSPVLGARLRMNVINNFGVKAIVLDYMKKQQVTIGPETITLESFGFEHKARKLKVKITTVPKTAKAAATVLEYGGQPSEFIRMKTAGGYQNAKLTDRTLAGGRSVEVQVKGKLIDGIMAVGGETTGTLIKACGVTWELDVSGMGLKREAAKLNGKTVVVTGSVRQKAGVEIAKRTILTVKTLEGVLEQKKTAGVLLLRYERSGGFAGFHDDLEIFADYTYRLSTPRHVKHEYRGKLSREHQTQLAAHLKRYGKVSWRRSDGPRVADGMSESIGINGAGALTTYKPNTLQRLLQQIIFAGRKGDKVPKK
jgi:hypothetical protein